MPSINERIHARRRITTAAAVAFGVLAVATPASGAFDYAGTGGASPDEPKQEEKRDAQASSVKLPKILHKIAKCESGGDPEAVSANGLYRGKYQFHRQTWKSMGGKGDPARASETEQDRRALKLYRQQGVKPWPVCGRS